MLLASLKDIIKGKYKIISIKNNVVYEEGNNFKVNGLNGWLEISSIQAKEDYIIIYVK
jgi:hypothetical protein